MTWQRAVDIWLKATALYASFWAVGLILIAFATWEVPSLGESVTWTLVRLCLGLYVAFVVMMIGVLWGTKVPK